MTTNSNSNSFDSRFNLNLPLDDEQVKFRLFVQARKISQLNRALRKIKTDPQDRQIGWMLNQPDLIDDMLNDLLDDSLLMLDGIELDPEAVDLSLQLMENIRQSLDQVHHLLHEDQGVNN